MRGGKRTGAGRPNGAKTKRTSEVAKAAAKEGITPLEFMLEMLRKPDATIEEKRWAAEKAAPYIHARLNSVNLSGRVQFDEMTDDQLDRAIAEKSREAVVH